MDLFPTLSLQFHSKANIINLRKCDEIINSFYNNYPNEELFVPIYVPLPPLSSIGSTVAVHFVEATGTKSCVVLIQTPCMYGRCHPNNHRSSMISEDAPIIITSLYYEHKNQDAVYWVSVYYYLVHIGDCFVIY